MVGICDVHDLPHFKAYSSRINHVSLIALSGAVSRPLHVDVFNSIGSWMAEHTD